MTNFQWYLLFFAVSVVVVLTVGGADILDLKGQEQPSTATELEQNYDTAAVKACLSVQEDRMRKEMRTGQAENVILVSADTLRADRLDTYRDHRAWKKDRRTSPEIDSFAEESVVFENAVAPAPWTFPSYASLFTGTYPRTHGLTEQEGRISDNYTTIAEVFRGEGYKTAGFHGNAFLGSDYGFNQGFEIYRLDSEYLNRYRHRYQLSANFGNAAEWLENNTGERSFVFVHGYDPHGPYRPPPPYEQYYRSNSSEVMSDALDNGFLGTDAEAREINGTFYMVKGGERTELSEQDIEDARAAYDSGVRYTDAKFGDFIDKLKDEGLYNDSVIVLIGDHGENLGERTFRKIPKNPVFGHWYLWKHSIHVPLIVRVPGSEPKRVEQPVSLIDLPPTLFDLQNVDTGERMEDQMFGASLMPIIAGEEQRRYVVSESSDLRDTAIRNQSWKLIKRPTREDLLYRLEGKREKEVEIRGHRGVYQDLKERVDCWRKETPSTDEWYLPKENNSELEKETKERLKDLGYLE